MEVRYMEVTAAVSDNRHHHWKTLVLFLPGSKLLLHALCRLW